MVQQGVDYRVVLGAYGAQQRGGAGGVVDVGAGAAVEQDLQSLDVAGANCAEKEGTGAGLRSRCSDSRLRSRGGALAWQSSGAVRRRELSLLELNVLQYI